MALDTEATIVPASIIGAYDLGKPGAKWPTRGHVTIRYMPPIYVNKARDTVDTLMEKSRERMLEGIRMGHANVDQGWAWKEASATLLVAYLAIILGFFATILALLR